MLMSHSDNNNQRSIFMDIFLIFLRLGLTSFGGPVAHLGYFRDEFVVRRQWITEKDYADLIALCQFLPGPASSQVGMALGLFRGGFRGCFAAWLGFTLPSALIMLLVAAGFTSFDLGKLSGMVHGLKVVAVAVVAQAIWGMASNLCPDKPRIALMLAACCFVLLVPSAWGQIGVIFGAGLVGVLIFKPSGLAAGDSLKVNYSRTLGSLFLITFFAFLAALPTLIWFFPGLILNQIDAFYRTGALVFGGGHIILPLLQSAVVEPGWVNGDVFLAGYGLAQTLPGPLTAFAAFLGASMQQGLSGISGGVFYLSVIFLPSFLLVAGALPFWENLRHNSRIGAALKGINAAVVGLLLAAFYQPLWASAIVNPSDFALGVTAFLALVIWKQPPWLVVGLCGASGWLLQAI